MTLAILPACSFTRRREHSNSAIHLMLGRRFSLNLVFSSDAIPATTLLSLSSIVHDCLRIRRTYSQAPFHDPVACLPFATGSHSVALPLICSDTETPCKIRVGGIGYTEIPETMILEHCSLDRLALGKYMLVGK